MSQTPEATAAPMALLKTRYELRIGEPAGISAPPETIDFLVHARTLRLSIEGQEAPGLVVASNQTRDRILLAPSLKAKPGEYTVTLSAAGQTGEARQATLDVVVEPRATVPNGATRPPVVLINGWETGFTGTCPVATSSANTFGNLAQYLVADGVPVVFLFDNCLEDPNQSIETLANDLSSFLNTIKYDDGTQVPQIDLVCHSMGGLIARAYLAGLQPNQTYTPPANTLVRKLVLIATPNFGSFVAGNYATTIAAEGAQGAELVPGSSFLWNLATWNQYGDDLRGVDAIAIIGNAGSYVPSLSSSSVLANASDGLVSLTSASLSFVSQKPSLTRIVPYCHVDPGSFTNPSLGIFNCDAPGIANVTSTSHYTSLIVRSFLAGTSDWSSIGTTPTSDPYLAKNGGMFFAVQNTNGSYVSDVSQVVWGNVQLQNGGDTGTIFFTDFIFGSGAYTATSTSLHTISCGTVTAPVGYSLAIRCKLGAAVFSITPLVTTAAGKAVAAGTTVTINGANLGSQCSGCRVTATAAGSGTAQALTVSSWQNQAIAVKLPASLTGFSTITVFAAAGSDAIGVMSVSPSTIAVAPVSLQFAYVTGGSVPSAQSIQITNSGTGTLAWTATASASWLSLSAASGTAPSTLSVSVSPAALGAGTYNGTIQISATGSSNSPVSIAVTLTVTAAPASLVVTPQALTFQYTAGGAVPAAQNVSISNGGAGTLSWTASSSAYWAVVSATSGNAPATLSISVIPGNLAAGSYTTVVTIAAADAGIGPASVSVTLAVQGTQPAPTVTAAVNAGSFQPGIASAAWVSIFGANLSQLTYTWQSGDFGNGLLPTTLEGVLVTINGLPAYVEYISPGQINALAPDDATVGPVQVQVTAAQQASNTVSVQKSQFAPAYFTLDGTYVAARHADYSLVGAPNLLPGAVTTPAKPGETILLYGAGFGPANPPLPSGQLVAMPVPLANPVQITIGGVAASVVFSGLVEAGLYQFNVTVPNLPDGDAPVVATIGGVPTQAGVSLTIQQ
ncbi:MAG TPA: hypothetical protein VE959_03535 [Bryobacteraceae bacterium]|nr:hypothetical protein [Bryobacteraceae bacterium]